ncbi:MAG: site-2 protease family protein [Planctomycetota bacterium]|nr:site-2 protease family protein [Planctomycetota bacterium]
MSYLLIAFVIGFLILIHELGHYLAARWVGIPVARFSIGFGPILWSFKRRGTEFGLAWFPFGGYVLPDIETEEEWSKISASKRILFALGGPAANVLLAVLLFAFLNAYTGHASAFNLLVLPWAQAAAMFGMVLGAIPAIFSHPGQLSGVVGIVAQGQEYVGFDLVRALHFASMLSVNLAVLNLLPIPALDGGKVLMACAEKVWPASRRYHLPLSVAGWVFLIGLMLFATIMDVIRVSA